MNIEPLQLTLAILHAVHDAGGEDEARAAVERLIAQATGEGDEDIDESVQSGDFPNITGQDILPRRRRIEESAHKYASTQIDLPPRLADAARALAARIPPADLAEDGVEDCPHLTVLFGLHGRVTHRDVCAAARKCRGVRLRLGETKYFPDSESGSGDVVYVAVEDAGGLSELRAAMESLPHTPTHPGYVPHVTLAYVKAGLGKKYAGMAELEGREWSCGSLLHSDRDRRKAVVPLAGEALAESAARGVRGLGEGGELTPAQRARLLEAEPVRREIKAGPRRGQAGWFVGKKLMPADWQPGGKKTSRNKVAKTASSATMGSSPARSEEKPVKSRNVSQSELPYEVMKSRRERVHELNKDADPNSPEDLRKIARDFEEAGLTDHAAHFNKLARDAEAKLVSKEDKVAAAKAAKARYGTKTAQPAAKRNKVAKTASSANMGSSPAKREEKPVSKSAHDSEFRQFLSGQVKPEHVDRVAAAAAELDGLSGEELSGEVDRMLKASRRAKTLTDDVVGGVAGQLLLNYREKARKDAEESARLEVGRRERAMMRDGAAAVGRGETPADERAAEYGAAFHRLKKFVAGGGGLRVYNPVRRRQEDTTARWQFDDAEGVVRVPETLRSKKMVTLTPWQVVDYAKTLPAEKPTPESAARAFDGLYQRALSLDAADVRDAVSRVATGLTRPQLVDAGRLFGIRRSLPSKGKLVDAIVAKIVDRRGSFERASR